MDDFANASVSYSPDGTRVASGSSARTLRVADVATGKELASRETPFGLFSVAFSPDGRSIAVGGGGLSTDEMKSIGYLAIHDASTCEVVRTFDVEESTKGVSYSLDGTRLAAVEGSGAVLVIELASGEKSAISTEGSRTAFLANGAVVALDRDEIFLVRPPRETVARFPRDAAAFNVFASRSREVFAVDTAHQTFRVMDMNGMPLGEIAFKIPTPAMALSTDGNRLALASGPHIRFTEVSTGQVLWHKKTERRAFGLDIAPDGRSLAWADAEARVTIEPLAP